MKTKNANKGRQGIPGSKPQDLDRRYDTTQLHESYHGRLVHRDYAAHFFRWGWASRFVQSKVTKLLDVGCGQECPLVKVLAGSLNTVPQLYIGCDLNPIRKKPGIAWVAEIFDDFDFVESHKTIRKKWGTFDLITNFEMIEHMHPDDGFRLLKGMRRLLEPDGRILLSTPVFNERKMAANHLHEYTIPELRDAIKMAGLRVEERFGTFASWNDIRRVCTTDEKELLDEVGRFYGGDVLACFLAPKYPDAARNNAWILRHRNEET